MADQRLRFIAEWVDKGLKRGAQDAEKSVKNLEKSSASTGQALFNIAAAAGAAAVTIKQIYNVAKGGAEIELTATRFDRLAASIGTTGDALRGDLADATDGLMSKAEQMQLAGDMMSLGLAKTSDQAVRLTKVASQLGMNMNQLTLTLSNQTTMRFDSLGVAVAGFDERLQALKDTGMDVNEAFTEAFLQQAEAQIDKVGTIADTSAGKMMKFEAAVKDIGDAFKLWVATMSADAFSAMAQLITSGSRLDEMFFETKSRIEDTSKSYDEYIDRVLIAAVATGNLTQEQADLIRAGGGSSEKVKDVADELGIYTSNAEYAEAQTSSYSESLEDLARMGREQVVPTTEDMIDVTYEYADSIADVNTNLGSTIDKYLEMINFMQAGGLKIQNEVEETWAKLAAGMITADDAERRLIESQIDLAVAMGDFSGMSFEELIQALQEMGVPLSEAVLKARALQVQMGILDGMSAYLDVYITTYGGIPKVNKNGKSITVPNAKYYNPGNDLPVSVQSGLDFVVPSAFAGDNYPVRATAGERVRVDTASETKNNEYIRMARERQRDNRLAVMIANEIATRMQ